MWSLFFANVRIAYREWRTRQTDDRCLLDQVEDLTK